MFELPNILLLLALCIVFNSCPKLSTFTIVLLITVNSPYAFYRREICAPDKRSIIFYLYICINEQFISSPFYNNFSTTSERIYSHSPLSLSGLVWLCPNRVCVFPDPVCPYARIVVFTFCSTKCFTLQATLF